MPYFKKHPTSKHGDVFCHGAALNLAAFPPLPNSNKGTLFSPADSKHWHIFWGRHLLGLEELGDTAEVATVTQWPWEPPGLIPSSEHTALTQHRRLVLQRCSGTFQSSSLTSHSSTFPLFLWGKNQNVEKPTRASVKDYLYWIKKYLCKLCQLFLLRACESLTLEMWGNAATSAAWDTEMHWQSFLLRTSSSTPGVTAHTFSLQAGGKKGEQGWCEQKSSSQWFWAELSSPETPAQTDTGGSWCWPSQGSKELVIWYKNRTYNNKEATRSLLDLINKALDKLVTVFSLVYYEQINLQPLNSIWRLTQGLQAVFLLTNLIFQSSSSSSSLLLPQQVRKLRIKHQWCRPHLLLVPKPALIKLYWDCTEKDTPDFLLAANKLHTCNYREESKNLKLLGSK